MTEWRTVPGYTNYQISIDIPEGKCRCLNYHRERRIKELSNKPDKEHNRIFWTLHKDGKKTFHQAAVWIALTYPELIENEYFDGAYIDHIDTDRLNNHPSNLRWVTPADNNRNPLTIKRLSNAMTNHPYFSKKVYQYDKQGVLIATYPSTREAYRQTGIYHNNISNCCNGKLKSAGGYVWKYNNI